MRQWKWNEAENGKMTFENICRLYSVDKNFKLSADQPFLRSLYIVNEGKVYSARWSRYEAGANFGGGTIGSDYFVLKGKCEITINGEVINLQSGECFEFPKGEYKFRAIGDETYEYIAVYKLPDDVPLPEVNTDGNAFR